MDSRLNKMVPAKILSVLLHLYLKKLGIRGNKGSFYTAQPIQDEIQQQ